MTNSMYVGLQHSRWSVILLLLLSMAATFGARAAEPILVTDHGTYLTGEAIKVGFTNGPANAKDWIGIYPAGVLPGTGTASTAYLYVDGTSGGATGKASGEVTFASGLSTAGSYTAYLLRNDGYQILAQQDFMVQVATDPQVRLNKRLYAQGEIINLTFSRGPGGAKDWLGIYPKGVTPGAGSFDFRYVDNTETGTTGFANGTVTFNPGLVIPGEYVVYFLPNDDYIPVAQESFTVLPRSSGLVTIQTDHDHYLQGQTVRFKFDGGPGNATDWIGIYRPGQIPGDVGSTTWRYVNNTQGATVGFSNGELTMGEGLAVGNWVSYFMLNDGYEIASDVLPFTVVEAFAPIVQVSKREYNPGEAITATFTNAPGNAKDWIAIYKKGSTPGVSGESAILWNYTDGTRTGTAGVVEGSMTFASGLSDVGDYVAYLLENDGYTVLSSEAFTVRASGLLAARIVSVSPVAGSTNNSAAPAFRAVLENRDTTVVQNSIVVKLDNVVVPHQVTVNGSQFVVTASTTSIFASGSDHSYSISFNDSASTLISSATDFKIGTVVNITLPAPVFFESFETTAEGAAPAGWTVSNQSDQVAIPANIEHLGSSAYENFTVVAASRLGGNFWDYSDDPAVDGKTAGPVAQILNPGYASYIVNGSLVTAFADGKILLGVSGYHGGSRQVLEAVTPDINLTGKTDVYIAFHSLLDQNQDSIEGIEVSSDGGTTWAPVVYYLDPSDIILAGGAVDFEQTFNTPRGDIAVLPEAAIPGSYGSFLKAPIDAEAGAHVQGRRNDVPEDGTRVELIRVPTADNKAAVRFRLFYAGTDSWYFGVDNFGVYSIPSAPSLSISKNGGSVTISWPAAAGFVLQSSTTLLPGSWSAVSGVTGNSYTTTATTGNVFYRLFKP